MPVPVYAVVPSYGRECVKTCLDSLVDQADLIFLVQTREFAIRPHPKLICLPWDASRALNISAWWNMGIKAAAMTADGRRQARGEQRAEWDVLVVNDDVIAPPGLAASLGKALRAGPADLAYLRRPDPPPEPLQKPLPPRDGIITGWCFMLRGESGIMADPQFHWWWGDIDIELQARNRGGIAIAGDCQVRHLYPGGHDQSMATRIALDTELFREKWQL